MKLTKAQREWVAWALDPMQDYALTPEDSGYDESGLPTLKGNELIIVDDLKVACSRLR